MEPEGVLVPYSVTRVLHRIPLATQCLPVGSSRPVPAPREHAVQSQRPERQQDVHRDPHRSRPSVCRQPRGRPRLRETGRDTHGAATGCLAAAAPRAVLAPPASACARSWSRPHASRWTRVPRRPASARRSRSTKTRSTPRRRSRSRHRRLPPTAQQRRAEDRLVALAGAAVAAEQRARQPPAAGATVIRTASEGQCRKDRAMACHAFPALGSLLWLERHRVALRAMSRHRHCPPLCPASTVGRLERDSQGQRLDQALPTS